MSALGKPKKIHVEERVGPNKDKHAIIIDGKYREVHDKPTECADCRRIKSGEKPESQK